MVPVSLAAAVDDVPLYMQRGEPVDDVLLSGSLPLFVEVASFFLILPINGVVTPPLSSAPASIMHLIQKRPSHLTYLPSPNLPKR
jgi:hypothetical protein